MKILLIILLFLSVCVNTIFCAFAVVQRENIAETVCYGLVVQLIAVALIWVLW